MPVGGVISQIAGFKPSTTLCLTVTVSGVKLCINQLQCNSTTGFKETKSN